MKKDFCASCNRLRVSAKGKLHLVYLVKRALYSPWLQNDEQQTELQQRLITALQVQTRTSLFASR